MWHFNKLQHLPHLIWQPKFNQFQSSKTYELFHVDQSIFP
jgi:predicted 2-oxoglutarate/Fe(II)-dependent dioxygenase YbiX